MENQLFYHRVADLYWVTTRHRVTRADRIGDPTLSLEQCFYSLLHSRGFFKPAFTGGPESIQRHIWTALSYKEGWHSDASSRYATPGTVLWNGLFSPTMLDLTYFDIIRVGGWAIVFFLLNVHGGWKIFLVKKASRSNGAIWNRWSGINRSCVSSHTCI